MAYISQINFGDGSGVKDLKDSNAVSTIASQGLNTTQQENARNNIGTKLKSTTNATYDSNTITNVVDRQYAVTPDKSGNLSVNVPWESGGGSSAVTGVKGDSESTYRTGNVNITKANIGLGNVPNVTTNNQTPTFTAASTLATLTSGEKLSTSFGKIAKAISDLISHIGNTSNPHSVTASQVGLGNVGNFKAVSTVANQGLTTTEKTNARTNIGAGTGDGTVTRVDIGSTQYSPSSGVISLPDYPTVPTVNNSTITIQKNSTTVDSFTTNASSNKTIDITISKSDVGLGNVDNKSSATIRSEITASNVTTALGYTPVHWTELSVTKTANVSATTNYEFSSADITTTSTIDVYADVFGWNPTNITVSNGACTVTMAALAAGGSHTVKIYVF